MKYATVYYVRSYAINEVGISYGNEVSFKTAAILPSLSTSSVSNVTFSSAVVSSNVVANGGASITERGVVYSTSSNPTTANSKVESGTGVGAFTCNLTNLQPNTTYFVRAYAINSKGTAYGTQVSFTTDYEYVDLGLSVKWATMNVGASSPEDYGDYFAWGETSTKSTYDWSTYKWYNGSSSTLTKYNNNSSYGTVDNKTTLNLSDDAARANWGGSWRMPTYAEMVELKDNCTWKKTTRNNVSGVLVTSNKSGYTDKSIFLPSAGVRSKSSLVYASNGYYWSSSLYTGSSDKALLLGFSSNACATGNDLRAYGITVRPVCQ